MEGWVDVCVLVTPLAVGVGEYCFSPLVSLNWLCWEGKYSDQLYVGGMNVYFVSPVIKADGQNAPWTRQSTSASVSNTGSSLTLLCTLFLCNCVRPLYEQCQTGSDILINVYILRS